MIAALGEESSVQLSLFETKKKTCLVNYAKACVRVCLCVCVRVFFNAAEGVGPRILGLSLTALTSRQKLMNAVSSLNCSVHIDLPTVKTKPPKFAFASFLWGAWKSP